MSWSVRIWLKDKCSDYGLRRKEGSGMGIEMRDRGISIFTRAQAIPVPTEQSECVFTVKLGPQKLRGLFGLQAAWKEHVLPAPQQHQLSRAERNSVCLHCREVMLSHGCCAWTTFSRHHNSSSSCRVQLARMLMPRLRERWVSFWFLSFDDITVLGFAYQDADQQCFFLDRRTGSHFCFNSYRYPTRIQTFPP